MNFATNKFKASGILYVTKEKLPNLEIKKMQKSKEMNYKYTFSSFSSYFNEGVKKRNINYTDKNLIMNYNLQKEDKKSKMASTSKLEFLRRSEQLNEHKEYLNTENNYNNSDEDDSEYFEKLKSKGNIKVTKKPIEMSVWISDTFPLKLAHFIPLLHILSFASTEFAQLKSTLCSNFLPFDSFPMKVSFPLGFSFYALLTVTGFSQTNLHNSLFDNDHCNTSAISNINPIDDNYAKDFYEKYYEEKKNNKRDKKKEKKFSYEDSDFDQSSSFEKIREFFITNTEEDNPDSHRTNYNYSKNEGKIYIKNNSNTNNNEIYFNSNHNLINITEKLESNNRNLQNFRINTSNGADDDSCSEQIRFKNENLNNINKRKSKGGRVRSYQSLL